MPRNATVPVKFQRSLNREVDGVKYYHLRIVGLDPETVEKLGWDHLDELDAQIKGDSLVLRRKK